MALWTVSRMPKLPGKQDRRWVYLLCLLIYFVCDRRFWIADPIIRSAHKVIRRWTMFLLDHCLNHLGSETQEQISWPESLSSSKRRLTDRKRRSERISEQVNCSERPSTRGSWVALKKFKFPLFDLTSSTWRLIRGCSWTAPNFEVGGRNRSS